MNNLLGCEASVEMGLIKRLEDLKSAAPEEVGLLKIKPIKIHLKDNAIPYSIATARRVSVPMLQKVKKELERMFRCRIIEEIKEPTEWCPPMVAVPKKNRQILICVDLKQLNKAVKRERYMLPSTDDILPRLAHAKVFSQLPLDEDSAKLTTYFFRRLQFGITSAPEIFQREISELLKHQPGVAIFMDDILVYGKNMRKDLKAL